MKISFITLFQEVLTPYLNTSIPLRAQKKGKVNFEFINLREFGEGVHQVVDSRPFGGGVGMVLRADILAKALKSIKGKPYVLLTSASGKPYTQKKARELSKKEHLVIVCGHYEGIDQRFIEKYVSEEVSVGDYVLSGGELPSLIIADSITRLIPGVLEKEEATLLESFENDLLEYPQYARPAEFEGLKVPSILVSGDHQEVDKWRKEKSLEKTKGVRPELLDRQPNK